MSGQDSHDGQGSVQDESLPQGHNYDHDHDHDDGDVSAIMSDTSNRSISTTASPLLKRSLLREVGALEALSEDGHSVGGPINLARRRERP